MRSLVQIKTFGRYISRTKNTGLPLYGNWELESIGLIKFRNPTQNHDVEQKIASRIYCPMSKSNQCGELFNHAPYITLSRETSLSSLTRAQCMPKGSRRAVLSGSSVSTPNTGRSVGTEDYYIDSGCWHKDLRLNVALLFPPSHISPLVFSFCPSESKYLHGILSHFHTCLSTAINYEGSMFRATFFVK